MSSANDVAFIFPGQGSQKVGMLADAYKHYSATRDTFTEASDALGYDVWALVQDGPQETLNLTAKTQPVLLTSSVALWRAWREAGGSEPAVMAGHSLGEFSALVCAGVLQFADAVKLVRSRGEFMQSAVPVGEGAMAAIIGMDDADINSVCEDLSSDGGEVVAAVNFNSPGQVVIAGHTGAVDQAVEALKERGAKRAVPLPVSAPFHTTLMKPAGEQLAAELAGLELSAPVIPVVHNVHAETEEAPLKIAALLVEQIYSPVQWTRCIEAIAAVGAGRLVECGPGKVLTALNRRIDRSLQSFAIEDPEDLQAALQDLA